MKEDIPSYFTANSYQSLPDCVSPQKYHLELKHIIQSGILKTAFSRRELQACGKPRGGQHFHKFFGKSAPHALCEAVLGKKARKPKNGRN